MVTTVRTDEHTDALLAALAATGRPVGDATGEGLTAPYIVLYPLSGMRGGPIADPDADAELVYQMTCVGLDRLGTQWLADEVAEVVQAGFPIPGRVLLRAELDSDGGVRRDDDVSPPVFFATPRWRLYTTPA